MAAKRPKSTHLGDHTMEHVLASEARRLVVMLWPWPLWLLLLPAGWRLHKAWHGWGTAWMVLAAGAALAALALHLTHRRRTITGKLLAPATMLAAFTWVALAEVYGTPPSSELFKTWLIGGGCAAIGWSMWLHIHDGGDEAGNHLFATASEHTSVPGLRAWVTEQLPGKVSGVLKPRKGVVVGELIRAAPELEAALSHAVPGGLAPGSLKITEHPGQSHLARYELTDPRKLDKPVLWPGPYKPGASIAEPCRIGTFVDGTPWLVPCFPRNLPGWQCLLMGMTGAGKTTGLGYSWLGDIITRRDVVVCGIDLSKGEQFLGCMRGALHTLDLDYTPARQRLWRLHLLRRQRSDYLATQGLTQWEEGCGLSAIVVWIEEVAAFFRQLGDAEVERWVLPLVLEARSAGIFIVQSLQRADFTQMPTVVRAQLGGICMGVRGKDDADFGLSDEQSDHGCAPERWKNEKPGMAYSDTPGLPDDRYKYTEARSYYWGRTTDLMAAHAAKYLASARPADAMTQHMLIDPPPAKAEPPAKATQATKAGAATTPQPATQPATEEEPAMAQTPEPTGEAHDDPRLWQPVDDAEPGDYDEEDAALPMGATDAVFGDPAQPDTGPAITRLPQTLETATAALERQVRDWWDQGITTITLDMLLSLTDDPSHPNYIDRSRPWLYPAMAALVSRDDMQLEQHDGPRRWTRAA